MFTAEALVPLWAEKTGISALDSMAARPVLIEIADKTMRGEMLQLTIARARVMPFDPILLWSSVHVKIRFMCAGVTYQLTGMTISSHEDNSFSFEFDCVTRKYMSLHGKRLADAGLMEKSASGKVPAFDEPVDCSKKPEKDLDSPPKKASISAVLVRHDGPPGGRERRVHHRYEIDAEAKLSVVNSDRTIACTVLELSLSGCRVHSENTNGIARNTQVEVQFVNCGLPLRIAANVQVKTGEHLIGLKFLNMSSRMKDRLNNLIWEVAEQGK
jgi:hypothetical protein